MMDTDRILEHIKIQCCLMMDESEKDSVGEKRKIKYELYGKSYEITIDAYWDKSNFFYATVQECGQDKKIMMNDNF